MPDAADSSIERRFTFVLERRKFFLAYLYRSGIFVYCRRAAVVSVSSAVFSISRLYVCIFLNLFFLVFFQVFFVSYVCVRSFVERCLCKKKEQFLLFCSSVRSSPVVLGAAVLSTATRPTFGGTRARCQRGRSTLLNSALTRNHCGAQIHGESLTSSPVELGGPFCHAKLNSQTESSLTI